MIGDTLSRARAQYAFEKIQKEGVRPEITARLKGLPVDIRTVGLTLTIAVLLREASSSSHTIVAWIRDWLTETSPVRVLAPARDTEGFLEALVAADPPAYLAAQQDALALTEHLKLIASALEEAKS